ncbi:MAG: metallophosphoesterase, partial [Actinomycetota bacterium]|nr:metallophosphoesterase [Actinomycetota bacterium]
LLVRRRAGASIGVLAAAGLAVGIWGWFEAGWVRLRELRCPVPGLPPELEGLRVAHLSDLHLGVPSRGVRAVESAVDWVARRQPDLTCITGDLLTRPAGEAFLRRLVPRLPRCYAVLGNHDFGLATDPFVERSALEELEPATLLSDDSRTIELRGRRVQVAGIDPRSWRIPDPDGDAGLRILLSHYPHVIERLEPGAFHLVLAGHMHAGQIVVPYVAGKLRFAHLTARLAEGIYRREAGTLHVSPGLGTTFVPFRLFARPEATELELVSG